jgi:hypothetical protein
LSCPKSSNKQALNPFVNHHRLLLEDIFICTIFTGALFILDHQYVAIRVRLQVMSEGLGETFQTEIPRFFKKFMFNGGFLNIIYWWKLFFKIYSKKLNDDDDDDDDDGDDPLSKNTEIKTIGWDDI